jgi:hypothetical protein
MPNKHKTVPCTICGILMRSDNLRRHNLRRHQDRTVYACSRVRYNYAGTIITIDVLPTSVDKQTIISNIDGRVAFLYDNNVYWVNPKDCSVINSFGYPVIDFIVDIQSTTVHWF